MSKNRLSFKIIDYKPNISDINDYYYQIINNETKFKDFIYCSKNNKITDTINITKNVKYTIKFMKKGKTLGVGNLMINQDLFSQKINQKEFNNVNLFINEQNYIKIFPKTDLTKINKFQKNISLSILINIKYNDKEKESITKKCKLIKRNYSYQDRTKIKTDYSIKNSNILTSSTTYLNTYNNINNLCDNENNNENTYNAFSSEKCVLTTPSYITSPTNVYSPLSESNKINKTKKIIRKGKFKNKSFKINTKYKCNNMKLSIFDSKNINNQKSSRNNNHRNLFNKKKLNIIIDQESSSSNSRSTISQISIIDSILVEKNIGNDSTSRAYFINKYNNDTIQNRDYKTIYNDDKDNYYTNESNNKNMQFLIKEEKRNNMLFKQEEIYNKINSIIKDYENKIIRKKKIINELTEKNDLLKNKEEINLDVKKGIIPIITKVKESKEIEGNIINIILKNYKDNYMNKNSLDNADKYDKNLMIKMLKNIIQSNNNVDLYLDEESKLMLKKICDKYHIFGSIIEDIDEE
jgi:hypothetical protein